MFLRIAIKNCKNKRMNKKTYKPLILNSIMGTIGVKIKIMPSSPNANLEKIKKESESVILKEGGKNCSFEIQPIAFGLNAVIAFFAWQEEKELEKLEQKLRSLDEVNSAEITDMRRAFG